MNEATKHTPYELVFGQPPRSLLIPDNTLMGKINEEDLEEVYNTIKYMYAYIVAHISAKHVHVCLSLFFLGVYG